MNFVACVYDDAGMRQVDFVVEQDVLVQESHGYGAILDGPFAGNRRERFIVPHSTSICMISILSALSEVGLIFIPNAQRPKYRTN